VEQSQGLLQKHYQQPRGHFVGAKLVGLDIGFLGEHEGAVAEAWSIRAALESPNFHAQIGSQMIERPDEWKS
jgi:hypothetical protein